MIKIQKSFKQRKNELIKIAIEIIIGVILSIIIGIFLDFFISTFIPEYKSYEPYINEGVHAAIILIIGFLVTGSIIRYIEYKLSTTRKELYGISLIIRIVMYIFLLALVLSVFHVNITGLLAGSAIGGVVLGLAVQTVASNLLSGIFVTSTRTFKYGSVVNINSWLWSIDTTGKIIDIKTLFSKLLTKDNTIISIPNSALLGSGVIVEFNQKESKYIYPVNITVAADVPVEKVIEYIKNNNNIDIYLSSKSGITNVLLVMLRFNDVLEINKKTSEINELVDKAYWEIKTKMLLVGNNALYEYNQNDKIYPLAITLNSDVASDKIIEYVNKSDNSIKVHLLSKTGGTNIFSAEFTYNDKNEVIDNINRINLLFEKAYNDIKNDVKK